MERESGEPAVEVVAGLQRTDCGRTSPLTSPQLSHRLTPCRPLAVGTDPVEQTS